jgi:hypothetical protein
LANGNVSWDSSGNVTVTGSGEFTGKITANSGDIANWDIMGSQIRKENSIYLDSANEQIFLGSSSYDESGIGFSGSGEGFLANGNVSWDSSGNLSIVGADLDVTSLPQISDNGLKGLWKFDNSIINAVTGVINTSSAGLSYEIGVSQQGVKFDSNSDIFYGDYGNGIDPTTQDITLCYWVIPETNYNQIYSSFGSGTGTNQRSYVGIYDDTWDMGIQGDY